MDLISWIGKPFPAQPPLPPSSLTQPLEEAEEEGEGEGEKEAEEEEEEEEEGEEKEVMVHVLLRTHEGVGSSAPFAAHPCRLVSTAAYRAMCHRVSQCTHTHTACAADTSGRSLSPAWQVCMAWAVGHTGS